MVEFTSLNREVNINRSYITMYDELSKRKEMDSESKESYDFIKNKIQSAKWFIEALNQRNSTLKKTMRAIIDRKITNPFEDFKFLFIFFPSTTIKLFKQTLEFFHLNTFSQSLR